ncbi:glycosyltransferase [Sphingomonas bacterium]|uniref:glycosyltransferase n=1 Tax=Sphingomonas bacterium TaxID=1895847 RepID=UPI00261C0677|nr:glycosyltransferase [Sphingomonas bacterium]MDB5678644.1 glycosyl transferase family 1 [Sphingomonas bacterium]
MRIVDVNEFYSPTGGGVRTYIDRKMAIMADLGHELICIACGKEDSVEERVGGGKIIYVKSPGLPFDKNYGLFSRQEPIWRLLDALDPDVVETSSVWRPAWIVGRWQGRALKSFFMHNDNIAAYPMRWLEGLASPERIEAGCFIYARYTNRALRLYDTVVTNGPALEKRLKRRGVRIDAAMTLGIERRHFSPGLRDERLRAAMLHQLDLPADGHLLLGMGRHHGEKRWPMVVDAVERAGERLPVGLMLLGTGPESKRIEARIAGSPHIKMFRPVYDRTELARIMASCDALIHGSEAEPFGLVPSEAMASGLPLIVPDTGGCAEIADPLTSETFRPRNAADAALAIERLFAREPAILRKAAVVAAGKVRTDRDHTIDLMAHYAGLIAEKAGRAPRLVA